MLSWEQWAARDGCFAAGHVPGEGRYGETVEKGAREARGIAEASG